MRLAAPLLLTVCLLPAATWASELTGRVVGVADGDTLTLLVGRTQHEIRLSGIDTPERGQPYGDAARKQLSTLVFEKEVRVEGRKIDRYGRIVGRVWVQPDECPACGKTLDVSLALLTTGMGWWHRDHPEEQPAEERGQYEFAEFEAKAKKAGLWRDANPIPPWDWRKGGGSRSRTAASAPARCVVER